VDPVALARAKETAPGRVVWRRRSTPLPSIRRWRSDDAETGGACGDTQAASSSNDGGEKREKRNEEEEGGSGTGRV